VSDLRIANQRSAEDLAATLELVEAATAADGVGPLSEQVLLNLRYGGDSRVTNLLLYRDGALAGYAQLNAGGQDQESSGELVVHPAFRRQGLGLELLTAVSARAAGRPLRVWAHGDSPAAARLAERAGFTRDRALLQLRRPLRTVIPAPEVTEGVTIRTFVPGHDEDAWIALNARAFAEHPEQGSWTKTDLDRREREPWFEPAGFFLADRGERLAGFHWTKIHGQSGREEGPGDEPIGEVYVVGVDPDERGTGLGRALTLTGLRYLKSRGLGEVMLYVDETNPAAIKLYESLGFTRYSTDVMYAAP
jgi:mycothiol synthase